MENIYFLMIIALSILAAVAIALLIIADNNGSFSDVINYINTTKAAQIIGAY